MPAPSTSLALVLAAAGVTHVVAPHLYERLVPPELGPARPWVLGSGVAELVVAGLVTLPATRAVGGRAAQVLFATVFVGNLQMARDALEPGRSPGYRVAALARLPLQVPLLRLAGQVARST